MADPPTTLPKALERIADMMFEGDLCEACGCFIDEGGGQGFPRYCSPQCAADRGAPRGTIADYAAGASARERERRRKKRQRRAARKAQERAQP